MMLTSELVQLKINCMPLQASLDDPTHTVVMHRSEPSRLQSLALQLTDKVNSLVDYNERVFETKQGESIMFVKEYF